MATTTTSIPVSADNFPQAESHAYFSATAKRAGGSGVLDHQKDLMPVDHQTVVRPNRDTIYSSGVFDLDAGPVTFTLPDPGPRFLSLLAIDEQHYAHGAWYAPARVTLTREDVGVRYFLAGIRAGVDPTDPGDLAKVHALQQAIRVEQKARGAFEPADWDPGSLKKVREALLLLSQTLPDSMRMFGTRDAVDPVRHLIGTAFGWGGNPEKDAYYLNVTPARNDGKTAHRLEVRDVPVDAFWSISVYNAAGYFEPNAANAYTVNGLTARKGADGSVVVRFGGDGRAPNSLPIVPGWNYTVRLYRPRPEILSGAWSFPKAVPEE